MSKTEHSVGMQIPTCAGDTTCQEELNSCRTSKPAMVRLLLILLVFIILLVIVVRWPVIYGKRRDVFRNRQDMRLVY